MIEVAVWLCVGVAATYGLLKLFTPRSATKSARGAIVPVVPFAVKRTVSDDQRDSAFAILSRNDLADVAETPVANPIPSPVFTSPKPLQPRPILRGIVWSPDIRVLLEGVGLAPGGVFLQLQKMQGEFTVTRVSGDTAVVRGRDSTWVLILGSRNP